MPETDSPDTVWLIARVNETWRDIYGLLPDQENTVGRVSGNQIIVPDEHCSRKHCIVLRVGEQWQVRDLGSRNGTQLNGEKFTGERLLTEGDILLVGATEFLFAYDTSATHGDPETAGSATVEITPEMQLGDGDGPAILERKRQTRFLVSDTEIHGQTDTLGRGFRKLFRASLHMVSAASLRELADTVLDCLQDATGAEIGAVLLFDGPVVDAPDARRLRLVGYRVPEGQPYHNVSTRLSGEALRTREAILGLDIGSDPTLSEFQTLSAMNAESVICVPVQDEDAVHGLIHLYSLTTEDGLDAEALEFTMAVAEEMVGVIKTLRQRDTLARGLDQARDVNRSLQNLLEAESQMVGDSPAMQQLDANIRKLAVADATVLVRGESGVGKELVSRLLHLHSPRRAQPLVCLNCTALTETLLESELFGHEKGAFTGATARKAGKFEQATGGTLFLDEVGEMSQSIQAKFLRVLEGHPFERVGGSQQITADVRVVAATNRDLEDAVRSGEFRKDLFYRLQVLELHVPPLRDHVEDVSLLAAWFLERSAARVGVPAKSLTPAAIDCLRQHDWPGNVREFRNVIERSAVLAPDLEIGPEDLHFTSIPGRTPVEQTPDSDEPPRTLEEIERLHILHTLKWTGWVKRESARLLEIERSTLDRKIKRYGLEQFK